MKRFLRAWHLRFTRSLTLRWRLTLWTAGLFLALGFGLIVLLSGLASIRVPQAIREVLLPTQYPSSEPLPLMASPTPLSSQPGASSPGAAPPLVLGQVQEIAIHEVRIISLISVGIFTLLGAWGAYWIAQRALQPVRRLTSLVQEIQVDSLHRRLSIDGPQDEVKALADAFDDMLERLERAFEQQSRFVADASHELRTPLAVLRTNLEVIRQDPNATLADYREMVIAFERALDRLEALVDALLLLAKGEQEIQTEAINLEVLLTEVVHELEPLARDHRVSLALEVADDVVLSADVPLLVRAISNLVENGIRYNRPDGSVTITVSREADWAVISVRDTGIGIPPEEQSRIFDRFYRVDQSRARHRGGAGLGLSITAHIVQLHGGRIQVESTPGVGSTFSVYLPL